MAKRDFNVDIDLNNNDLLNVDSVALNTSTTDGGGVGKIWWNPDHETANIGLDANVTLQVGQEHLIRVKNASGTTAIPEFTFVMFAGATGDTVTVSPAVTNGTVDHQYMVGVTTEEISADGFGFVVQFGYVNNIDTSAYTLGQLLYPNPSVAGGFTTTQPSAPAFDIPVAAVTRVHATTGRVLVRMSNGLRLKDLHDVQIDTPADNELLSYDSSSGTWINQTPTEAGLIDTSATAQTKTGNFTSSGELSGNILKSTNSATNEGGEIFLALPSSGSTLSSGVNIDVYQNKLRIFESGGTNRGAYIDLTATSAGVGSNLLSGGSTVNSFATISTPSGTSPVADSSTDTLTLVAGAGITITGDSSADSITIASTITDTNTTYDLSAGGTTSPTISLVGSNSTTDTVTFAAGTNVSLSQSAGTITINATDTNTTYTAGTGLTLTGTQFSVTPNTYQPLDADLTALGNLSTTGFVVRTGAGSFLTDSTTYLSASLAETTYAALSGATFTGNVVGTSAPYVKQTSGLIYQSLNCVGTESTSTTATEDVTYYSPFYVAANSATFDQISIRAGSNFSGFASVRLGIYADNNGKPGNLILDAGTVSVVNAGTIYSATISQSLSQGMYWLAANSQTAATTNTYYFTTAGIALHGIGLSSALNATPTSGYTQTGVTGAFANAGTVSRGNAMRMSMRVA